MISIGEHELTDIQAETLLAIYEFWHEQENVTPMPLPPSVRDLQPMLGVRSTSGIDMRIKQLVNLGLAVYDKEWERVSRASTRLTHTGFNVAWHLFRENELRSE